MTTRRYPIGIQTFSRLRRDGYIYIDKTDLVWQLAHYATFVFICVRAEDKRHGARSLRADQREGLFLPLWNRRPPSGEGGREVPSQRPRARRVGCWVTPFLCNERRNLFTPTPQGFLAMQSFSRPHGVRLCNSFSPYIHQTLPQRPHECACISRWWNCSWDW